MFNAAGFDVDLQIWVAGFHFISICKLAVSVVGI